MDEMDNYGYDEFQELHRLETQAKWATETIERQNQTLGLLEKRMLDLEAEAFANSCEHEIELARWKDGIAASVGQDLQDITDMVMGAIEAYRRGEDIDGALFAIYDELTSVWADLTTMDPDAEV